MQIKTASFKVIRALAELRIRHKNLWKVMEPIISNFCVLVTPFSWIILRKYSVKISRNRLMLKIQISWMENQKMAWQKKSLRKQRETKSSLKLSLILNISIEVWFSQMEFSTKHSRSSQKNQHVILIMLPVNFRDAYSGLRCSTNAYFTNNIKNRISNCKKCDSGV